MLASFSFLIIEKNSSYIFILFRKHRGLRFEYLCALIVCLSNHNSTSVQRTVLPCALSATSGLGSSHSPHFEVFAFPVFLLKLKTKGMIIRLIENILTRTSRNQTGLKIKKIDHESTKIQRHESLNVVLFRAFNLSCFRDCVSEFSARKNTNFRTKVLMFS